MRLSLLNVPCFILGLNLEEFRLIHNRKDSIMSKIFENHHISATHDNNERIKIKGFSVKIWCITVSS